MKNKIYIIFFIFLFLLPFAYPESYVDEDFHVFLPFSMTAAAHTKGCANFPDYPVPSYFGDYAFGINASSGLSCSNTCDSVCYNMPTNITSDEVTVYGDVSLSRNDTYSVPLSFTLSNKTCTGGTYILYINFYNGSFVTGSNLAGFAACTGTLPQSYNISFKMSYSYNTKLYAIDVSGYGTDLSGYTTSCSDYVLTTGTVLPLRSYTISSCYASTSSLNAQFDNLVIDSSYGNTSVFPVNYPCTTNADCQTKNCVFGVCRYKTSFQACTSDYECLSGNCINNKCEKAGTWSQIDNTKDELFGSDKQTSNFIVFIIMILSIVGILVVAGIKNAIKAGMYLSILVLYLEAFFFAIVGWLSFFIVFALVLVAVIFIIATIFIMNRMPN